MIVCLFFQVGEDSSNRKFLVSRLFDVAEGSTLEESSTSCIRLEWNKGIVGHVASTGQLLNIKNAYEVKSVLFFFVMCGYFYHGL